MTNTSFTYDNAGNETFDGVLNYAWDAENHLKSANGVNYTYDGDLRRVEKSNGKLYWYNTSGQILEETDLSGNLISDYIYFARQRIARRDSSGATYYYFTDPLGTVRGIYSSGSSLCYDADFYPFGGEKAYTNTCAQNYKFTGLERDTESGLDETLNRMYSSGLGRWLGVDPVRGCIAHPQGLNRYVYVTDNPASRTDRSGAFGDPSTPDCPDGCQDPCFARDNPDVCSPDCMPPVPEGTICPPPQPDNPPDKNKHKPPCVSTPPPYSYAPIDSVAGGNLCTQHPDHPYFWWSWTCEGETNCCLGEAKRPSVDCDHLGRGFFFEMTPPGMTMYGSCCGPMRRREPPPKP